MPLNKIETELIKALQYLAEETQAIGIPTAEVKITLYKLAVNLDSNIRPYASQVKKIDSTSSEWLYDMTWWESKDCDIIDSIKLVVESERGNESSVLQDFKKLIQARSENRLLIFECNEEALIKKIKTHITAFKGSILGDRYLLIKWQKGKIKAYHLEYSNECNVYDVTNT